MTARSSVLTSDAPVAIRLLRIALPLTLAASVRYLVELSGIYWMGKLGVAAIAVVSSLSYFLALMRMFAGLTSAGTSAVIGRLLGEDRRREASYIGQRVTTLAPILGLIVAVPALLSISMILRAAALPPDVQRGASQYLVVLLLGMPVTYALMALHATLVGLGHPRASFEANVVGLIFAFALTPLFVVGARLGLLGAALAQVAGEIVALAYGTVRLRGLLDPAMRLPLRARIAKLGTLVPVLRVGTPLTVDAVLHATVGFALVAYMARFGADYVAAQGTEERLTQVLNLPTEGLAPAAATLVGYNVGRGRRDEARSAIIAALCMMALCAFLGCLLLLRAPRPIVAFLCDEPGYVGVSAKLLAVAAIALVFLGTRDVIDSAFGGVGNTWPPLFIGLVVTVVRFPLAIYLSRTRGLGGLGITWAINGTLIAQAVVLLAWLFIRFDTYATRATEADRESSEEMQP
jgi:putative MATE family efflux protein